MDGDHIISLLTSLKEGHITKVEAVKTLQDWKSTAPEWQMPLAASLEAMVNQIQEQPVTSMPVVPPAPPKPPDLVTGACCNWAANYDTSSWDGTCIDNVTHGSCAGEFQRWYEGVTCGELVEKTKPDGEPFCGTGVSSLP